jgi:copper chaperone CopZ
MLIGMRFLLPALALFLALAGASRAASPGPIAYSELPPGRYTIEIRGMVCTVCARAIAAEWSKLPEVEGAAIDFEKETGVLSIRLSRTLQVSSLRRALRRAERVANLGVRFELRDIRYLP